MLSQYWAILLTPMKRLDVDAFYDNCLMYYSAINALEAAVNLVRCSHVKFLTLDKLSGLTIQVPVRCDRCGFITMPVNARLRLRGSQGQWNFKLPVCGKCDCEPLKALSPPAQPIKPRVM
jgi:hypothetical protein